MMSFYFIDDDKNITAQRFFTIILGLFYLFYRVFMIVFFVFSSLF